MRNLEETARVDVASDTNSRILLGGLALLGGAVLAGIGAKIVLRSLRFQDEDRPPIIVRGGSVNFESGTSTRPGQPWERDSNDRRFRPNHPNGKPVRRFRLYFVGGASPHRPLETESFTVEYDPGSDSAAPRTYTVEVPTSGRRVPTITGDDLNIDPQKVWRVHGGSDGQGTLLSITVGSTTYSNGDGTLTGTEIWVESIR